ncbi:MAG: hypothetical protein M1824_000421 [Vezdaea acicularis]|nr:MAG: hypothetical protein M1824_000421 [Vezdaea acicularis]
MDTLKNAASSLVPNSEQGSTPQDNQQGGESLVDGLKDQVTRVTSGETKSTQNIDDLAKETGLTSGQHSKDQDERLGDEHVSDFLREKVQTTGGKETVS